MTAPEAARLVPTSRADALIDAPRSLLGEGPIWAEAEAALYWVDLYRGLIHRRGVEGDYQTRSLPFAVGAVAPSRNPGLLAVAGAAGFYRFDFAAGICEPLRLVRLGPTSERSRFNEARCDMSGRLWAGAMIDPPVEGRGALWVLESDGLANLVLDGLTLPNGLGWSPDEERMSTGGPRPVAARTRLCDPSAAAARPSARRPQASRVDRGRPERLGAVPAANRGD